MRARPRHRGGAVASDGCGGVRCELGLRLNSLDWEEPLTNLQLPQPGDEFDSYGNSSQEDSTSSQGQGVMMGYGNGAMTDRSSDHGRRRKRHGVELDTGLSSYARRDAERNDQDDEDYDTRISEEHYRSMLGEHVQKYRKVRFNDFSAGMVSARMTMPGVRRNHSSKVGKFNHEALIKEEAMFREMDKSPEYIEADFESDISGGSRYSSPLDSSYLDIGEGITYRISQLMISL